MTPTPGTPLTDGQKCAWPYTNCHLDHEREAAASREALRERIEALPWSGGIVEFRNAVLAILATEAPEPDEPAGDDPREWGDYFADRGTFASEAPKDRATPRSR